MAIRVRCCSLFFNPSSVFVTVLAKKNTKIISEKCAYSEIIVVALDNAVDLRGFQKKKLMVTKVPVRPAL